MIIPLTIAALVAGAFSMAGGEYVSVSTQRDTEVALIAKEKAELKEMPDDEFAELDVAMATIAPPSPTSSAPITAAT
mgnify:CR=1 FL=1